jgi:zinc/manganese transport system substrate-binding protein
VTREIAADLGALRPEAGGAFAGRAESYVSRLEELDRWVRAELSVVPKSRRQLVTSHDAFAWFAQDYGFIVHPINGISPQAEPNGRDLAALIDLIRRDRIPAVFVESSANPALVTTITRETGARLGGFLYADGLSADGEGTTYAGMIRHNVRTLAGALR